MKGKRSIRLASDDRARIPFAVIAALLLVTSATVVYGIQRQESEKQETSVNPEDVMQSTKAAVDSAIQKAARESLELAGEKPVTTIQNPNKSIQTPLNRDQLATRQASPTSQMSLSSLPGQTSAYTSSQAIPKRPTTAALAANGAEGNPTEIFHRYTKLRFYLNLERRIERIETEQSNIHGDSVSVDIKLPHTRYKKDSLVDAIDRVSIDVSEPTGRQQTFDYPGGSYTYTRTPDSPIENYEMSVGEVDIVVDPGGGQSLTEDYQMETVTQSAIFDMHDRVSNFESKLTGDRLSGLFTIPAYATVYSKAVIERFLAAPFEEAAYEQLISFQEMRIYMNWITQMMMRTHFGTAAGGTDEAGIGAACLGYYHLSRWIAYQFGVEVIPPQILCLMNKKVQVQSTFESGKSLDAGISGSRSKVNNMDLSSLDGSVPSANGQKANEVADEIKNGNGGANSVGNLRSKKEVSRERFVNLAYKNITGGKINANHEEALDEVREGSPNDVSIPSGERNFDGRIARTIMEMYHVGSMVSDLERTSDNLNTTWKYETERLDWVSVDSVSGSSKVGIDGVADIELQATVRQTQRKCRNVAGTANCFDADANNGRSVTPPTETVDVTYEATLSWGPAASVGSSVDFDGIVHPFTAGRYTQNHIKSFIGARRSNLELFENVGSNAGYIESNLSDELDDASLSTEQQARESLQTAISQEGTQQLQFNRYYGRQPLKNWLEDDITNIADQIPEKKARFTTEDLVNTSKEGNWSKLLINESTIADLTYEDSYSQYPGVSNRYPTPSHKTRAELRRRFLQTVNWYINDTQRRVREKVNSVNEKIDKLGGDVSVSEGMEKRDAAEDYKLGDSADKMTVNQPEGAGYLVQADPDWLTNVPKSSANIRSINPPGEVREDREAARFTSLAMRKVNLGPAPGIPLVPPFWFVSMNYWHLNMKGEYARFAVRPKKAPNRIGNTSYVREIQPVHLRVNGFRRYVGYVEPVNSEVETGVVGFMPGPLLMPEGNLGIGPQWYDLLIYLDCTSTWPEAGPGAAKVSFLNPDMDCPSLGAWGEMVGGMRGLGLSIRNYVWQMKGISIVEHPGRYAWRKMLRRIGKSFKDDLPTSFKQSKYGKGISSRAIARLKNPGGAPGGGTGPRGIVLGDSNKKSYGVVFGPTGRDAKQALKTLFGKSKAPPRIVQTAMSRANSGVRQIGGIAGNRGSSGALAAASRGSAGVPTTARSASRGSRLKQSVKNGGRKAKQAFNKIKGPLGVFSKVLPIADIATIGALLTPQFAQGNICPRYKKLDEDHSKQKQHLGCDDDQLVVKAYRVNDDYQVEITSERTKLYTDRTLIVDSRTRNERASQASFMTGPNDYGPHDSVYYDVEHSLDTFQRYHYYVSQDDDGDYDFELQDTGNEYPQEDLTEAYMLGTDIRVEKLGDSEAPVMRFNYDGSTFLVTVEEDYGNWDTFAENHKGFVKDVDVFITSQNAFSALKDDVDPKSVVAFPTDGSNGVTCPNGGFEDSPVGVYTESQWNDQRSNITPGLNNFERVKFMVTEEGWLKGPEMSPTMYC